MTAAVSHEEGPPRGGPTGPRPAGEAVLVRTVGTVVLVRAEGEPPDAFRDFAAALPGEDDRVAVVCTPRAGANAGLFAVLPDIVSDHFAGGTAVRLVLLGGDLSSGIRAVNAAHGLAADVGVPVTVPLGPLYEGNGDARWVTCRPDGTSFYEAPWAGLPPSPSGPSPAAPRPLRPAPTIPVHRGIRTAAGWSFSPVPSPLGSIPALVGTLVEVDLGPDGPLVAGLPQTPADFAALLAARMNEPDGPVVVFGTGVADHGDRMLGALADALGVPVIAAGGEMSVGFSGVLTAGGDFRVWEPGGAGPAVLGPALPVVPFVEPGPATSGYRLATAPISPASAPISPASAPASPASVSPASVSPAPITPASVSPVSISAASVSPAPTSPASISPAPAGVAPASPAPTSSAPGSGRLRDDPTVRLPRYVPPGAGSPADAPTTVDDRSPNTGTSGAPTPSAGDQPTPSAANPPGPGAPNMPGPAAVNLPGPSDVTMPMPSVVSMPTPGSAGPRAPSTAALPNLGVVDPSSVPGDVYPAPSGLPVAGSVSVDGNGPVQADSSRRLPAPPAVLLPAPPPVPLAAAPTVRLSVPPPVALAAGAAPDPAAADVVVRAEPIPLAAAMIVVLTPRVPQWAAGIAVPAAEVATAPAEAEAEAEFTIEAMLEALADEDDEAVAEAEPAAAEPEAAPEPALPAAAAPVWVSADDWAADDRTALRGALDGRYDTYSRVVVRTLAEEPGLRAAAADSVELVSGLVALRAYCAGDRAQVNTALRDGDADERVTTVARGAAFGLRALPAVFGPVFRTGRLTAGQAAAYRTGAELVEPGFLDVQLAPAEPAEGVTEFVIWSVSARRLGKLGGAEPGGALFAPGTRFVVLGVDDDKALTRVLLCDAGQGVPKADRILARLRAAPAGSAGWPESAEAPGVDQHGRAYRREAA